jgi:hypothetical protein
MEVATRTHRVGEHGFNLLVRADDKHRAHRGIVSGCPSLRAAAGIGVDHVVALRHGQVGVADQWIVDRMAWVSSISLTHLP